MNDYMMKYATAGARVLLEDNLITEEQEKSVMDILNRTFAALNTEVSKILQKETTNKKSKKRKPYKKSGYRAFIDANKSEIKKQLEKGTRFMTKASQLWKALSDDEQSKYKAIADEFNAKKLSNSNEDVEVAKPIVPEITTITDLAGPYEGTYIAGSVDRKTYKTLAEAYQVLKQTPHAVGITRKAKNKFKIRCGYSKSHNNIDFNGKATPKFVYRSPGNETSWVLKTAIDAYETEGP